jgi:hypothetical protein
LLGHGDGAERRWKEGTERKRRYVRQRRESTSQRKPGAGDSQVLREVNGTEQVNVTEQRSKGISLIRKKALL